MQRSAVRATPAVEMRDLITGRLVQAGQTALAIWSRAANSRLFCYAFFAAVYTAPTLFLAHRKLLWDDEFFTLYLSTTSWTELMSAMATGADQHPPSFYYLTHLLLNVFGASNVTLRLTAIVGFGVMCLSLYEIVGRILNREWGFCAMLLPLPCPYYWYALEARGYGIQLGFVGLAFVAWMMAGSVPRRPWSIVLLAASLCGAVGSHYYAGLILLPLAAGEIVRTIANRRIDWPIWLSFVAAFIPVAAFARIIMSAQSYSAHFWAIPRWPAMISWYPAALSQLIGILLAVSAVALLVMSVRPTSLSLPDPRVKPWHAVAFLSLSLLPVIAMIIAKLVTHAFIDRYVIAAFPGVCVLIIVAVARLSRYGTAGAAALSLFTLLGFAGMASRFQNQMRVEFQDLKATAAFLREAGDAPIALSDITRFHRLSYYAKRDLGARVAYLADPQSSVRYMRHDTVDRGLLALRPWFPLNVRRMPEWLAEHPTFLVWGFVGPWSWLPNALMEMNADMKVAGILNACLLFSVKDVRIPQSAAAARDDMRRPALVTRMPRQGKPICEIYMTPGSCPSLD